MADISIKELIEEMVQSDPHKIILSGGRGEYRKVVFERKIIGGKRCFQIERYTEKQVFHQNIDEGELEEALAYLKREWISLYLPIWAYLQRMARSCTPCMTSLSRSTDLRRSWTMS